MGGQGSLAVTHPEDRGLYSFSNSFSGTPASLVVQLEKNPFAMQETPDQFLGLEEPLEKE